MKNTTLCVVVTHPTQIFFLLVDCVVCMYVMYICWGFFFFTYTSGNMEMNLIFVVDIWNSLEWVFLRIA
jgi:hypothetical protein